MEIKWSLSEGKMFLVQFQKKEHSMILANPVIFFPFCEGTINLSML